MVIISSQTDIDDLVSTLIETNVLTKLITLGGDNS